MKLDQLTEEQLDTLKEVSNIGSGHAATALSQLMGGKRIDLRVPRVYVVPLPDVPELIGGAEKPVVGIYLKMLGEAPGNMLLIFPEDSAQKLLQWLSGADAGTLRAGVELGEEARSVLSEVGNILASSYLNALGALLKVTLIPSIPFFSHDMAGAVVDYILIQIGKRDDLTLVLDTDFRSADERFIGHFFILPDPQSIDIIFRYLAGGG